MFNDHLRQLEAQHLRRHLRTVESPSSELITIEGRSVILMASNNYLGLATHPHVKQAAMAAIEQYGVGSGASRLISGTFRPHQQLEGALARFKQTEAALVFGTGYMTNVGVIPALISSGGLILADRLCHASLIDGCRLSGATLRIFRHNDIEHLRSLLAKRAAHRPTLIVTEGIFSMDGDAAPLPELVDLAPQHEASLLVDDAHGTGVMGQNGRGSLENFGLAPSSCFQMGTLSKALGSSGGYIVGPKSFAEYLINSCRSFLYTTAPPPAMAAAAQAAIELIQSDPDRRVRLWKNREYLYDGLKSMGFRLTDSQSPILPVLIKDPKQALDMSQQLYARGVYVPAIRPPTVPKGSSRLRLTVTSEHTAEQIDTVLGAFREVGEELKII